MDSPLFLITTWLLMLGLGSFIGISVYRDSYLAGELRVTGAQCKKGSAEIEIYDRKENIYYWKTLDLKCRKE